MNYWVSASNLSLLRHGKVCTLMSADTGMHRNTHTVYKMKLYAGKRRISCIAQCHLYDVLKPWHSNMFHTNTGWEKSHGQTSCWIWHVPVFPGCFGRRRFFGLLYRILLKAAYMTRVLFFSQQIINVLNVTQIAIYTFFCFVFNRMYKMAYSTMAVWT